MGNTADNTGSIIGWKDVTDVSGVISLFLCYIVNKHVSHNPWMYIMAGITVVAAGLGKEAYRRKHRKASKGNSCASWTVFYLFVGVSFIVSGILRLIAEYL